MTILTCEQSAATPCLQRLRIKSKAEIGEKDALIPQRIKKFRTLIEDDENLPPIPEDCDQFILRCLRARKYDMDRCLKLYRRLCNLFAKNTGVVDFLIPSEHNALLKQRFVGLLRHRDALGRQIMYVDIAQWAAAKHCLDEALAALLMTIDQATMSVDTQLNGLMVLVDCKGFSFAHARQVSTGRLQAIIAIIQDSFPARFKELHFFNNPSIFNMVFNLCKPFIKEKMRDRFIFHGHNLKSVHRSINPAILPEFIGGKLPANECFDDEALRCLLKRDDYFKEMFGQYMSQS